MLFSLYAIAAGKRPEELTAADVADPSVVRYIKEFQGLVDHYIISSRVLNSKVHQGPRYGQFFLMPEDNLIHLIDGTEPWYDPLTGAKGTAPPITRPMVMVYPKEGSLIRDNCACIVRAPWVADEQTEAAEQWIDYLREDNQQRGFMTAGFRPGTNLPLSDPASKITARNGLDPNKPAVVVNPDRISPAAAAAIDRAWVDVKKPGILTFVADVSGSMAGDKLQQAKDGLIRAMDGMAQSNRVGLIAFSDTVLTRIPVAPLEENRYLIADAARAMQARSGTALYDAIKAAIEMTDGAAGDTDAIRGVVVLTDGQANRGQTRLDNLISMMSRNESDILQFDGFEGNNGLDERFRQVPRKEMIGTGLALQTRHRIQVFFIGIGRDADMDVGRLLAEATGAEFQGASEKDLAAVLEEFGKYF